MNKVIDNSNIHQKKLFNILPEGRVEYNGKCITMDNNGGVYDIECTYAPIQEWKYANGNIYALDKTTNKTKCLHHDKTLYDCDITINGNNKDINENDVRYPKWHKKFGKNVVLVSSDNPWYINHESTTILEQRQPENKNANYTDFYKPYGIYNKANMKKIDKSQPSTGIEGFSVISNKSQLTNPYTILIIILLIIIISQIIFLMCYSKK